MPAPRPGRDRAGAALGPFLLLVLLLGFGPASAQVTPAATPPVCRIGVNVEDIYDLDPARDTFGAILWVWSLCPSADLSPLATITFPTASTGLNLSPIEVAELPAAASMRRAACRGPSASTGTWTITPSITSTW